MGKKPKIYIPIATGTSAERDIRDRLAEVINVKDFGAIGDGITNDTAAWNQFTAVEGGVKYIPMGNYLVNGKTLSFPYGCIVNYVHRYNIITRDMIDEMFSNNFPRMDYNYVEEPNCIEFADGKIDTYKSDPNILL